MRENANFAADRKNKDEIGSDGRTNNSDQLNESD